MRAVLYVRVSKGEEQDPETQLRALREWAAGRGWRVISEKCDCVTGDPRRRKTMPPELAAALQLLRSRKADVLAVWALDRVVRSMRDLMNFLYDVERAGGVFASMRQPQLEQLSGPMRDFVVAAHGLIAELELDIIRERTKAGLERARADGKELGRPKQAPLDLDEVRRQARKKGGYRGIARRLGTTGYQVRQALAELDTVDTKGGPSVNATFNAEPKQVLDGHRLITKKTSR